MGGEKTRMPLSFASSALGPRSEVRFVLGFVGLALLFELLFTVFVVGSAGFRAYMEVIAGISAWLLRLLGWEARAQGRKLVLPLAEIEIMRGCDGLEPVALFVLAVVLFPVAWRRKLAPILIGTTALVLLNIVRVVSLALVHVHSARLFDTFHEAIWPAVFILAALALWLAWAWRAQPSSPRP